jgi:hypothetical protein
MLEVVARVNVH